MLETAGAPVTWFATHKTSVLSRLGAVANFDLGIHPNFNPLLLDGDSRLGATASEVIRNLMKIVPHASSVRSHSILRSSRLTELFYSAGLRIESNDFVPAASTAAIAPWRDPTGMVHVAFRWADDLYVRTAMESNVNEILALDGAVVLTFHPIHIVLNTADYATYEASKMRKHDPDTLDKFRNEGQGVRTFLEDLLERVAE